MRQAMTAGEPIATAEIDKGHRGDRRASRGSVRPQRAA